MAHAATFATAGQVAHLGPRGTSAERAPEQQGGLMNLSNRSGCVRRTLRRAAILILLVALLEARPLVEGKGPGPLGAKPASKVEPAPAAVAMEVRFTDDSTMKVVLKDSTIELLTNYGKLLIPTANIQRIEFGWRIPAEVRKRIDKGIANLSHDDFQTREAASTELLAFREQGYHALLQAAKGKDGEAVRRAKKLLEQLREQLAGERLEIPLVDVVFTGDSKIAGHIAQATLRVSTMPFGDQQAKLKDMLSVRAVGVETERAEGALPDPGGLMGYQAQVGKTFAFKVTGPAPGGGVFGTNIYTLDSSLAMSALHAGAIRSGQTGVVRVTILGPQAGFAASVRNGVTSSAYGPYPGFRVEPAKRGGR